MKKIVFALFILVISIASVSAQDTTNGGFKRAGGGTEMREKMKQRLKDKFDLTDTQLDSVVTIQQDFQKKIKELRKESLEADKLTAKTEKLEAERKEKFKSFLSEDQVNKLEEFYEKMKKTRDQKQKHESSDPS